MNCFLFDYFDNHPLGIIYDWIRNNDPKKTLIIKHLGYVPYCKSGSYRLKNIANHKKFYKILRTTLLFYFLKFKGYKIYDLDKFIVKNKLIKCKNNHKIPSEIKKEILRDFICTKEKQASFIDLRYKFTYYSYKKSLLNTFKYYDIFFKFLSKKYKIKNFYIFNGRALRQKLFSLLAKNYKYKLFYIERNMWNKGRTIISKSRIQSFDYLKTNTCNDYFESKCDITVDELYNSVMLKQYKTFQSELFEIKGDKPIISYLSGSSDEYCAFTDEVMLNDCKTQIKLVKYLSDFCFKNDLNFILRVHPNSRRKSKMDLDLWNQLEPLLNKRKQLFFPANSNVNTYLIIENSKLIVTNGSTVSVEACLMNKTVALCGFNGLRKYNAAFMPNNINELTNHIKNVLSKSYIDFLSPKIEAQKYLLDELKSGRKLNFYSMLNQRINL